MTRVPLTWAMHRILAALARTPSAQLEEQVTERACRVVLRTHPAHRPAVPVHRATFDALRARELITLVGVTFHTQEVWTYALTAAGRRAAAEAPASVVRPPAGG